MQHVPLGAAENFHLKALLHRLYIFDEPLHCCLVNDFVTLGHVINFLDDLCRHVVNRLVVVLSMCMFSLMVSCPCWTSHSCSGQEVTQANDRGTSTWTHGRLQWPQASLFHPNSWGPGPCLWSHDNLEQDPWWSNMLSGLPACCMDS